jgi:hypothetical protein
MEQFPISSHLRCHVRLVNPQRLDGLMEEARELNLGLSKHWVPKTQWQSSFLPITIDTSIFGQTQFVCFGTLRNCWKPPRQLAGRVGRPRMLPLRDA